MGTRYLYWILTALHLQCTVLPNKKINILQHDDFVQIKKSNGILFLIGTIVLKRVMN